MDINLCIRNSHVHNAIIKATSSEQCVGPGPCIQRSAKQYWLTELFSWIPRLGLWELILCQLCGVENSFALLHHGHLHLSSATSSCPAFHVLSPAPPVLLALLGGSAECSCTFPAWLGPPTPGPGCDGPPLGTWTYSLSAPGSTVPRVKQQTREWKLNELLCW